MKDHEYMKIALELAGRGCGFVNPNPMVGALVVKDGEIIGRGYHEKYGQPHAEQNAIANCNVSPVGASIYVTLEPCCHYGKTPPCCEKIIESGITRVIIGSADPNPLVKGKGVEILRENGIEVVEDVLRDECDALNEVFLHYIKTGLPYIVMKYAMTIDGKIATYTGKSKWITGELARERVHEDRHKYSAIMIGVGTLIADDPMLNCRIENCKDPIRIICDTNLKSPIDSRIVRTANDIRTIIATSCDDREKQREYIGAGCEIIVISKREGHVDLKELILKLGDETIDSIIIEGGGNLNWSAIKSGIVNKVQSYIAPKIFGGESSKNPVEGMGIDSPEDGLHLKNIKITHLGPDILIESEVEKHVHRDS